VSAVDGSQELFDSDADAHKLTPKTRDAIARIRALREEPTFRIQFNLNDVEHSMLLFASTVSPTTSLLKVESGGRLMLMVEKHGPRVRAVLGRLAENLNWRAFRNEDTGPASEKLPTIPAGHWEHHVPIIMETIRALAKPRGPIGATGPTVRKRSASESSPPVPPRANELPALRAGPAAPSAASPAGPGSPDVDSSGPVAKPVEPVARSEAAGSAFSELQIREMTRNVPDERVREEVSRWIRARQSQFRTQLLKAYEFRCCISEAGPETVLEAAHIEGHAESGDNRVPNGLLLRSDLHTLFDAGLLTIDPDSLCVFLAEHVRRWYPSVHGKRILLPGDVRLHPDRDKLRTHFDRAMSAQRRP
jgi:hypothetical protein